MKTLNFWFIILGGLGSFISILFGAAMLINGVWETVSVPDNERAKFGTYDFIRFLYAILLLLVIPGVYGWLVNLIFQYNAL